MFTVGVMVPRPRVSRFFTRKFKLIRDVSAVAASGSVWVLQFLDPSEGPAADSAQAKFGLTTQEAAEALKENGCFSERNIFLLHESLGVQKDEVELTGML